MYRCVTIVKITQVTTTKEFPVRNAVLNFDFVHDFTASDSWADLTNKGTLTIPKNLYYFDANNKKIWIGSTNINAGGFGANPPLFLRGDKITIDAGYKYFDKAGREITDITSDQTGHIFEGFISKVHSRIPIELDLEDNMWQLKQLPVATHTFTASDTLEDMLTFMLKGTGFTINALTSTNFGEFTIGNETVCQVLERLRKTYGFQSYFRGNQLRCGVLVYVESEAKKQFFRFQQNIISDELEYNRKDDIVLSAIAHNTVIEETGAICKDGSKKTRRKRLEVLVQIKNNKETFKVIERGDTIPENTEGERRTLFFPGAVTTNQLADLAFKELRLYYYTGLKGEFTTFGIPFVRQGDNVDIKDPVLPERNGLYKVKSVKYRGGVEGLRQTVKLDFKINV